MSEAYRPEIINTTCLTCPLRVLPEIYYLTNTRELGTGPSDVAGAVADAIEQISHYTPQEIAERRGDSPVTEILNVWHGEVMRLYDDGGVDSVITEAEDGTRSPWAGGFSGQAKRQLTAGAGMIAAGSCLDRVASRTCDRFRPQPATKATPAQEPQPIFPDMGPAEAAGYLRQVAAHGSDSDVREIADRLRDALLETTQSQSWHADTTAEARGIAQEAADTDPNMDRMLLLTVAMQFEARGE